LTSDFLKEISEKEEYTQRLIEHAPDGYMEKEGVMESLISSQLQQALESLDHAVVSEEARNIMTSLESFDDQVWNDSEDPMDAFIKTFIKKYGKK